MKHIKDVKRCLVRISDVDTGEIISLTSGVGYFGIIDEKEIQQFSRKWFECYMRGLRKGRNLELNLIIKDTDGYVSDLSPTK